MVFGQILKNILDKNQEVWLPTIGLLGYDKNTTKLHLDPYGSGTDNDLIHLISEIKQVSSGEAKGILIQEIESMKSILNSGNKFAIEGLGDLSFINGNYQFESKKTLFPGNFFGDNNFNPSIFQNNAPKVEEPKIERVVEKPKVEKKEEPKIEPEPVIVQKETVQEIPFGKEEPIAITAEESIPTPEVKEIIENVKEDEVDNTFDNESDNAIFEENSTIAVEESIQNHIDNIDEEIEEEVYEEEFAPIIVKEPEPEKIIIDEPRRPIGNSRYDDGYYDYDLTISKDGGNGKWKMVAGIIIGLLALSFLIPWIWASYKGQPFLGMKPLWESKKEEKKDVKPMIVEKLDTAKLDTLQNLASVIDSSSNSNTTTNTTTTNVELNNNLEKKTVSTTTTTPKNTTTPKTPASMAENSNKKPLAVANKKSNTIVEAVSTPIITNTTKDTTSKTTKTTAPAKIIGKPYATANYTKGNYYLSFGKFTIPTAAAKLRKDIKAKAGIETDVIMVDGSYRVVIPYISKEKAQEASKDYVSTTLFE